MLADERRSLHETQDLRLRRWTQHSVNRCQTMLAKVDQGLAKQLVGLRHSGALHDIKGIDPVMEATLLSLLSELA
jgi:hypothetical protein